ncbi:MAG: hypothetical protein ABI591_01150 [Kofleriaceae bacterium]
MDRDDRTIYLALVLIGMLPLIGAIVIGGPVGSGVTVCFLMVVFGIAGVVHDTFHHRPPQARVSRDRDR